MSKYIIFDLEWNMPSSWDKVSEEIKAKLPAEIIEIGAIKLDQDFNVIASFQSYVRPTVYKKLNKHVANITHRLQQSLTLGDEFPAVINRFWEWCEENPILCTWSDNDLIPLKSNLKYFKLSTQLKGVHIDLQKFFSYFIEEKDQQRSIEFALDFLFIDKDMPFHRAQTDAYYTGEILKASVLRLGEKANEYIDAMKTDINIKRREKIKLNSYKSVAKVKKDIAKKSWFCPACKIELIKMQEEIKFVKKRGVLVLECPTHGEVVLRLKYFLLEDQQYHVHAVLKIPEPGSIYRKKIFEKNKKVMSFEK